MLWKLSKLCIFSNRLRAVDFKLLVPSLDLNNKNQIIKVEVTVTFELWIVFNRLQKITM